MARPGPSVLPVTDSYLSPLPPNAVILLSGTADTILEFIRYTCTVLQQTYTISQHSAWHLKLPVSPLIEAHLHVQFTRKRVHTASILGYISMSHYHGYMLISYRLQCVNLRLLLRSSWASLFLLWCPTNTKTKGML